jgi:asparagine synthase (glutamine-hydrolysing)
MPGIVGIIHKNGHAGDTSLLDLMVRCMMHEPFYKSGTYLNNQLGLSLGWVCHEGSFSDCMPVCNENRDVYLGFAGENFADQTDIDALRAKGHEFDSGNASYLSHLYEEMGDGFLEGLNGWFSGVLADLRENKVVVFNDRFGLGRIYYHENADGFYFASEAKALLKVLPQLRQLDMQSFGEFFSCGAALQNRSLFSGISLLPAASVWTFRPQQAVKKELYFKNEVWENQVQLPASEYYEKLRETFTRILPKYFQGNQRVALSLTGGLDSRMIIASAAPPPESLPCYTFGGMYRECADVRLSKQIAETSRQRHQTISISPEFFSEFPSLAERSVYYTDGTMDVTGAVELFANRLAREIAPVRMTGNYGSEVLRANLVFKAGSPCPSMFDQEFTPFLRSAETTYAGEKSIPRTAFIVSKQVPWYHYARLALEQSQITVRSPYLDNELVALAYQAPSDIALNKELSLRFIADGNPALARIPTDRGVVARPGAYAGRFKVFRQEFMPRAEYVYDYGMPQWFAKVDRLLSPFHLERLFLGRQKFYHFRIWYRDQLSPYVKSVLLDHRTLARPYLNARYVEDIVTAHVKGRGNYTVEIHKLLTSELIQRQLIEQG